MEMCNPFGWHELTKEKLSEIRTKLAGFENSTWNDILVGSNKQNHRILVEKLDKEAKDRLIQLHLDDIDDVISLHLTGTERVVGIQHDVALTLLWWDPHHQVCPSYLKHT
jgi:hypothetical protein